MCEYLTLYINYSTATPIYGVTTPTFQSLCGHKAVMAQPKKLVNKISACSEY